VSRRLLFVESNTTGTGMLALRTAAELGCEPVLVTSDPSRYQGLDSAAVRLVRCDTNSREPLRRAVARLSDVPIAGVTTTSEFYLTAAAELARSLGLPGNPPDVVRTARDKAAVRRVAAGAGLGQPRFVEIDKAEQVPDAVAHTGLPCVVKPVDDSGSSNVLICHTEREATEHARTVLAVRRNVRGQPTAATALVEQYVEGPEFSVEMFSTDGEVSVIGVTAKTVSSWPYFVELGHRYPSGLAPQESDRLAAAAAAVVRALGVRTGPTHCELRLGPDGPVLIELNCRLAGGMIPELIRLAQGVDLIEQQLRAALGERPELAPVRQDWAGISFLTAARPGVLLGVPGLSRVRALPGVARAVLITPPGTRVKPATCAYDRLGHVIAVDADRAVVEAALAAAARLEAAVG
jgi:cysteine synthase A